MNTPLRAAACRPVGRTLADALSHGGAICAAAPAPSPARAPAGPYARPLPPRALASDASTRRRCWPHLTLPHMRAFCRCVGCGGSPPSPAPQFHLAAGMALILSVGRNASSGRYDALPPPPPDTGLCGAGATWGPLLLARTATDPVRTSSATPGHARLAYTHNQAVAVGCASTIVALALGFVCGQCAPPRTPPAPLDSLAQPLMAPAAVAPAPRRRDEEAPRRVPLSRPSGASWELPLSAR